MLHSQSSPCLVLVTVTCVTTLFLGATATKYPFQAGQAFTQHHIYSKDNTLEPCSAEGLDGRARLPPQVLSTGQAIQSLALHKTAETQAYLHTVQNPADCSKARYLITSPHPGGGLGSQFIVMSFALTAAINSNRVLIFSRDTEGSPYYDPIYCDNATALDSCYFQPISHCATDELYAEIKANNIEPRDTFDALFRGKKFVRLELTPLLDKRQELPENGPFTDWFIRETALPEDKRQYWWRAQAVAFFLRPNPRLQNYLSVARDKYFKDTVIPPGAISVHVRRGDKAREKANTPFEKYVKAAEVIAAVQPGVQKVLYVSAESYEAVRWFQQNATGWQILFANAPKPNAADIPSYIQKKPAKVLVESLLDLELAMECSHFIGTLSSNWSLLMDKLRSTTFCRAGGLFIDPSQDYPPSIVSY